VDIQRFREIIRLGIGALSKMQGESKGAGASCTILSKKDGAIIFSGAVFDEPSQINGGNIALSLREATYLLQNSQYFSTMQVEHDGGAIAAGEFICSLAGLTGEENETVMMVFAMLCGWLKEWEIFAICALSGNTLFKEYRDNCYRSLLEKVIG
jgi:hypothetical protein